MNNKIAVIAALAVLFFIQSVHAEDAEAPQRKNGILRRGLWATVRGAFRDPEQPKEIRKIKLSVTGMKRKLPVYAVIQSAKAPLAVIVNGTFGQAKCSYAKQVLNVFANKGYNVLTFDSFFTDSFLKRSRHGMPGNLEAEAEQTVEIVEAFLRRDGVQNVVDKDKIGFVGMSYGGSVVLNVARLMQQRKFTFHPASVRAFSVPVSFAEAIKRLDTYGKKKYEWATLGQVFGDAWWLSESKNPPPDWITNDMLQELIGRAFRMTLPDTVEVSDRLFFPALKAKGYRLPPELENLGNPNAEQDQRLTDALAVTFSAYVRYWVVPYWTGKQRIIGKGTYKGKQDLLNAGELSQVLKDVGDNVKVILTEDDPLNAPGAAKEISRNKSLGENKVVLFKEGGHLGYFDSAEANRLLEDIFASK